MPVDLPTPAPSPIHQGEPSLEAPAVDPTALQQTNPWAMAPTGNPLPRGFRSDSTQTPANAGQPRTATSTPGLMGPIGYDVE